MKHKKEIYEKMKRRDFGESMSDETKSKVLNFVQRQLRLYNVVKSFTADEIVKVLEDCDHLDDAIMHFNERK